MSLCPAMMRASAMRTASMPADSSPMKVREDPVTPCTIEILPASRLESCARNKVGRRSLISRSLRKAAGFCALRHAAQDRAVDGKVALAAAGGDDHVHVRENVGLAFDAGRIERKAGGIGADALPGLHLALIALLRDLRVEIDRRQRMHDERREGRGVGARLRLHQLLPMRLGPFAKAGHDADAGDPGLARARQPSASASIPGKPIRAAISRICLLISALGKASNTQRQRRVADRFAVAGDVRLGDRIAGSVMRQPRR